jgi:hypothetical protein
MSGHLDIFEATMHPRTCPGLGAKGELAAERLHPHMQTYAYEQLAEFTGGE